MFTGPPIEDSPTIDGFVSVLPRVSRNSIQIQIQIHPRKQLRGPPIYVVLVRVSLVGYTRLGP
jgi:hypothetical protein